MNFQKIVLIIASLLLIISLIIIASIFYKSTYGSTEWPPNVGVCPDYWVDLSGNGSECFNSKYLGTCDQYKPTSESNNTMNFDTSPYNGTDGTCEKYKWAKGCNLTWDGITSGVSNPCSTTTTTTT